MAVHHPGWDIAYQWCQWVKGSVLSPCTLAGMTMVALGMHVTCPCIPPSAGLTGGALTTQPQISARLLINQPADVDHLSVARRRLKELAGVSIDDEGKRSNQ
jgi:hypothetical protein